MIPADAVEAAMKLIRANTDKAITDPLPVLVEKILEAAAPYMMVGAWEEGYTLGYADCANKQESTRFNPHKDDA